MTTTTRDRLVCQCGFEGFLKLRENDQPFSGLWESYSLEGFTGKGLLITSATGYPADILAALNPTCPQCGQTNKVTTKNA